MDLYVVYGGQSSEHEVSIKSAYNIISGTDRAKYGVYGLYIDREGRWGVLPAIDSESLEAFTQRTAAVQCADRIQAVYENFRGRQDLIFFPIIHGLNGEDGTIQGFFEYLGFPYVGCGVLASSVGMEKSVMKLVAKSIGIPMGDYVSIHHDAYLSGQEQCCSNIESALEYPLFVKPSRGGSSIGISAARNRQELIIALYNAFRHDTKALVEELIVGREIELGILGNRTPLISQPGEFNRAPSFFDYRAKYLDDGLQMSIPAVIPPQAYEEMKDYAQRIYEEIGGSGLSRVDFFYTEDGRVLFNEINTAPGFTSVSMYPSLWRESAGMDTAALVDRLVMLGLQKYKAKKALEEAGND